MFRVKQESSLLKFLQEKTTLSSREIKRALEQGACKLNGKIERFGSIKLKVGDRLTFYLPKQVAMGTLKVLYQDPSFTLFNKPSGIVTGAEKGHHLVHRLDKGTSGVLLMARTLPMKKELEMLFRKREVKKVYIALVQGSLRKKEGTIENKLGKKGAFEGQTLYGSCSTGKFAVTHYQVLKEGKKRSLLQLHPQTGRTHQLRVHLAELGHPILGDLQYGRTALFPREIDRLCLHAYRLSFIHPKTGKRVQATAPLPKIFQAYSA